MKKKIMIILLIILIMLVGFGTFKYFVPNDVKVINNKENVKKEVEFDYTNLNVQNKASILMNLDTNQVIYQNNLNAPTPVYSVSKVMFLATTAKRMKEDNISYTKQIKVPKLIKKVNEQGNFSNAGLKMGKYYTIQDLFDGVMMPSGNDAAILLAYVVFGDHEKAVTQMNKDAKSWKMKDSSFVSTSGLDGKYLNKVGINAQEGKNLISPYDSVLLTKKVIKNYPQIIKSGGKLEEVIGTSKDTKIDNVNEIIDGLDYGYSGVYGLKTGSNIEEYSNCIIALKKNEYNQDIVAISFSSKNRQSLYGDIASMYDYLKTLDVRNVQDELDLNTKVGFTSNDVKFTLEKPYYLYTPKNQFFEYELSDLSGKYNKLMNRFYDVNKGDKLAKLNIVNQSEFFDGTPLNLSKVTINNKPKEKHILKKMIEFSSDLIKK